MKLSELRVDEFVQTLASDSPAPGGGSAAALCGAIGAGLAAMVAALTQGRKKYQDFASFAQEVEAVENHLQQRFIDVMERDTAAFDTVSEAFSLPKETEEQKAVRTAAIQSGLKLCTETPLACMALCSEAIETAYAFLQHGFNQSSASDLGVAFLSLRTALQGAWLNVCINLSSLKDERFVAEKRAAGEALMAKALPMADKGYEAVLEML